MWEEIIQIEVSLEESQTIKVTLVDSHASLLGSLFLMIYETVAVTYHY